MNGIGRNLKRIRLLKNLSLKDAGILLNMTATGVAKYEKGEILPDSKKLIDFANAYDVKSIDLLKVYNAPEMKFTSFRKKKRLTGQNLQLLEDLIQDEVAKYLEIIEMNNILKSNIKLKKYSCNNLEDAEKAANDFRNYINISNKQPLSDLINILENLGIIIIQIKNPDNRFDDFDGLSELVNNVPVIVLLDGIKDGARQRFTIAHELGHLVLNIIDEELDEEKLCNRFASALLMPKEAVINEFGISRGKINFFELIAFRNEFKVSYAAIVYRLKDLDIISEYIYKKLNIDISQRIGKKDPNPIQPEISYQFKRIVYKLEADEIISLNKACELLGVTIDEYSNEDNNY
ncbi:MAG: ImmA/IrrE family metallo-endopeptidase [Firmicutes bacterium]|nr:ImmA/IrrE family metallo-endopeptidase [Bacillota bacterium]